MAMIAMMISNSISVNARNGNFGKRIVFISRTAPTRDKRNIGHICLRPKWAFRRTWGERGVHPNKSDCRRAAFADRAGGRLSPTRETDTIINVEVIITAGWESRMA